MLGSNFMFAQEEDYFYVNPDEKESLDLGIRMGYAINGFYGDMYRKPLPLFAFTGGVYNRLPLNKSKNLTFYSEVSFSFKGAKFNESADSAIERIALIYFDFPIGLEYKFKEVKISEKESVKYRVFLGVQPSILARSSMFRNMDKESIAMIYGLPLHVMDYAAVAGMPVEFPVGYGKMGFSLYVKYGLRNINRDMEKYGNLGNFASGHKFSNWQVALNITF
ncbi:MAG: PorT family protein [Bacteroidia bacterium]|nr:PorT family protein [Bacteroidia bacterium]